MTTPGIGTDAWQGAALILEDSEIATRAARCLKNTRWDNLITLCSSLRHGISCKLSEKYSVGTQNLVKLVEFEDGLKWVARVSLLMNDHEIGAEITASAEKCMESLVATYRYLRCHTTIPVPEVHAFNALVDNDIGAPYMLLTYIHGTVADEIEGIELATDVEGTRHVLTQLANIMVELATCKFDRIGSIFANANGNFEIGPLLETDGGPYFTAQEYYQAVSEHRFHYYARESFANNQEAKRAGGLHLPVLFNNFMPIFTNSKVDKGPFSLTNTDFGSHNVLVDKQLNIIGLIDCDNIFAAPVHVVAQMPSAGCMSSGLPGLKLRRPVAQEVAAEGQLWRERFVPMVAAAEKNFGAGTPIADAMTSDAAWLVKGIENYQHHQTSRLVEWTSCYWYLYYRHILGPSAAVEFEEAAKEIDEQDLEEEYDEEEQEGNVDEEEEDEIVEEGEGSDEDGNTNEDEDSQAKADGEGFAVEKANEDLLMQTTINDGSANKGLTQEQEMGEIHKTGDLREEAAGTQEEVNEANLGKEVKEVIVTELENIFTAEHMVDLRERIVIELKELMESFIKDVKEELKQELKMELKAELIATTKLAHSERHFETAEAKGQLGDLSKAGGGTTMAECAEGQGVNVEEIAHGISDREMRKVGFANEGHALGEPARQELGEEQIFDDKE